LLLSADDQSAVIAPQAALQTTRNRIGDGPGLAGRKEEVSMRKIWLYAFPLVLAACYPLSAGAAGRGQQSDAVASAATDNFDYGSGLYIYADILKPHGRARGDAARQAATRSCDGGDSQGIGLAPFNACMRAHGWRFARFEPAPEDSSASSDADNSSFGSSGPDPSIAAIDASNAQAAQDASTAAAQQQFNDAMAAATQTMNNANFSQQ
jgi:hypothetical protein